MYGVSFIANGNPAGSMWVKEDMCFAELAAKFLWKLWFERR